VFKVGKGVVIANYKFAARNFNEMATGSFSSTGARKVKAFGFQSVCSNRASSELAF
jgi:hypothetical protein